MLTLLSRTKEQMKLTQWVVSIVLLQLPLVAITTTGDPNSSLYLVQPGSMFDGVAKLIISRSDGTFGCTGSLIGDGEFVLTAAHCLTTSNGQLSVSSLTATFNLADGDQTYNGTSYAVNPQWNGDVNNGGDIAVIRLGMTVDPLAQRYPLYRTTDELGKIVTLVGYGDSGDGNHAGSIGFGTKRQGQNQIDGFWNGLTQTHNGQTLGSIPGTPVAFDFDDGSAANNQLGNAGLGMNEVFISFGDSGGPAFFCPPMQPCEILGVHDFISSFTTQPNGSFGEIGGDTRVSTFAPWIDATIPEPASEVLIGAGLLGFAVLYRKRK